MNLRPCVSTALTFFARTRFDAVSEMVSHLPESLCIGIHSQFVLIRCRLKEIFAALTQNESPAPFAQTDQMDSLPGDGLC